MAKKVIGMEDFLARELVEALVARDEYRVIQLLARMMRLAKFADKKEKKK